MSPSETVDVLPARGVFVTTYTNWRGETAERTIATPFRIFFGSNQWHPEPQWLLEAFDVEKQELRTFSFSGLGWPDPDKR